MKSHLTRLTVILVVLALAIAIYDLTQSVSWGLVALLAGGLAYLIYEETLFRLWIRRPQQSTTGLSPLWRRAGESVSLILSNSRSRARSVLNELQQVRSVSDFIPDGWVILRNTNAIELFNEAASNLLGLNDADMGRDLAAIIRSPSFSRLLDNEVGAEIIETSSPIDDNIRLELRLVLLENNRKLILVRDVTELNRLLSMRQDFIANVSHELRTPLTVLIGYIETMAEGDLNKKSMNELAGRLVTPVDRMRSMVDDLMTLTTLESSPLPKASDVSELNMASAIARVIEEASQLVKKSHNLSVEVDEELTIECVPNEINSVIMNLVTNAIRYSPDGGQIQIRCFPQEDVCRFEIQDEGVGIPPERISRLTERFYRIDMKGSRARGGTGLGLAIVKHVLRRHNTELQVKSEVSEGSEFSFEIPLHFAMHNGVNGTRTAAQTLSNQNNPAAKAD